MSTMPQKRGFQLVLTKSPEQLHRWLHAALTRCRPHHFVNLHDRSKIGHALPLPPNSPQESQSGVNHFAVSTSGAIYPVIRVKL